MTSAALRSTPNLTVPSSQNTAPVLEFRCLYSHDLRRKSKRWQDGFLRFHTFNKRVMVYDVPRNFIGDTHWRDEGAVQDGDELELEKGVLVQVGEGMGSMEQDLTGLFEKRRTVHEQTAAKPGVTLSTPALSTKGTPAAPLTQLRPKSLNALLGTPRGPHGRAVLPTLSPFEQRRGVYKRDEREEGRPSKRQKQNPLQVGAETKQSPSLAKVRTIQQKTKALTNAVANVVKPATDRQKEKEIEVIEVGSSDNETSGHKHNVTPRPLNPRTKVVKVAKRSSPPPLFCSSSPPVSTTNHLSPVRPNTNRLSELPGTLEEPSANTTPPRSAPTEELPPMNPLRVLARKPRKKLMYKDLLPSKPSPSRDRAGDATSVAMTTSRELLKHARPPQPPSDELSTFHQAQQERLKARMTKEKRVRNLEPLEASQISYGGDLESFRDGIENLVNLMPPPPLPLVPPLPPKASEPTTKLNNTNNQPPKSTLMKNSPYGFTRTTTLNPNPTLDMDLTTMDQLLFAPSTLNRMLRRSNSAPNRPSIPPPPPLAKPPIAQNTPLQGETAKSRRTKKSPLRKCTSLPAKPVAVAAPRMNMAKVVAVDGDVGPWSREAFDLLDWWPPDRDPDGDGDAGEGV
ncbi:MAG: hypothetical protein M1830_007965 [Pleopsidium flavum]|nr:MAG: hypothetical protein M1830_007965 [Pleopsidium flavum]